MTPMKNDNRFSPTIAVIAAALFASGLAACNLVDDEPPIDQGATDGSVGEAVCLAQLEVAQAQCLPGMTFIAMWDEGNSSMTLIDDPAANIGVGPNAWLVQVSASADYVGTYQFDGDTCTVGCGWCGPGQSLCHSGLSEEGVPEGCMACIPFDAPDVGSQCAQFITACMGPDGGLDETGSDGGLDETGSDGGLDETGSDEGLSESEGLLEYDCAQWDPAGAVTLDMAGNAVVDAALVEEIAVHYGDPLADCDDTSFRLRSDGYFAIGTMNPNGLLAQMGLQPGDTILAVNGESMSDLNAIASTTVDLFLGSRITSGFTLAVRRGRETFAKAVVLR
jgi:hypothetical protein